ncbi:type I restriction endonuclease [Pseudonocardia asaccharolytica]|uniref:Restriction endonuclease type I HsdR N-terminal domain-containing protein n=1 Tax=Pseudonocardia asaccharolytica DSM 44247 = NBRC 16224 TaxID=1123024 RepID=A0A511D1E7_9PSEU|nr:type I restriction endonuclease [Pseudonocardia asaccharolytica]GEL18353.1 hypothetical protein PA7_21900 [Pseudonocardia asaccharolytica DSM 44247 = NBRC 16224]
MLESGWRQGQPAHYRRELGLDTAELFAFIGATQIDKWNQLVAFESGDPDAAQRTFAERVAREIDARGTLDVLRHGVKDRGQLFRLAYFRPAHPLADDALVEYEKHRLTVTRQLYYSQKSPERSLDLVLFVNGFPVATAELKNPLTGQTSDATYLVPDGDGDEDGDPLTASALARGRHETLSYFAFTATPKAKTLHLFGTPRPVTGNPQPFHVYSMRQAIEEGFILDVLSSCVT